METEVSLAILSSLYPNESLEDLLELLTKCGGDAEKAGRRLEVVSTSDSEKSVQSKPKRRKINGEGKGSVGRAKGRTGQLDEWLEKPPINETSTRSKKGKEKRVAEFAQEYDHVEAEESMFIKDGGLGVDSGDRIPSTSRLSSDSSSAPNPLSTSKSRQESQDAPPLRSAFSVLLSAPDRPDFSSSSKDGKPRSSSSSSKSKGVSLPPVTLVDATQIANELPCLELIPNILPKEDAKKLFLEMLEEEAGENEEKEDPLQTSTSASDSNDTTGGESTLQRENETRKTKKGWHRNRWMLFEREVQSPHTTSFYRAHLQNADADAKNQGDQGYDEEGWETAAQWWYNGRKVGSTKLFTRGMQKAKSRIEEIVNQRLALRDRHYLEWSGPWKANVAAANCYRGSKEGVGPHSDQLTHLGPRPTIASLSLGVTRIFRLRSQVPSISSADGEDQGDRNGKVARTYNVELPHNSLLIMHAGCQEYFKHSIPPVKVVDLWKPKGSSISYNERINITFRFYRPDFAPAWGDKPNGFATTLAPSHGSPGLPHCKCGIPCILRPDARGKARANLLSSTDRGANGRPFERAKSSEALKRGGATPGSYTRSKTVGPEDWDEDMLYFWQCNGGAQAEDGKGCGFFKLMDMEKEGRGRRYQQLQRVASHTNNCTSSSCRNNSS